MRNINVIKLIPFFDKFSSSKCTKCTIAQENTSLLKYNRSARRNFILRDFDNGRSR